MWSRGVCAALAWGKLHRMSLSRALPLLVLVLAPLAYAAEECALEAKTLKPQFASRLPKGFKLVSTKKVKRELTQVLKLPDGYEVTLTFGGCEHLAYTFAFRGPGLTTKTVGAELVAIAKRELPTLPMDKDSIADPVRLVRALDEARISIMPAQLPCGDATCEMSLVPDETKQPKTKGKPKAKPKGQKDEPAGDPAGVLQLRYDLPL